MEKRDAQKAQSGVKQSGAKENSDRESGVKVHGAFGLNAQILAVAASIVANVLVILTLDGTRRTALNPDAEPVDTKRLATMTTVITSALTAYYLVMSYDKYKNNRANKTLFWFLAANVLTFGAMLIKLQTEKREKQAAEQLDQEGYELDTLDLLMEE